MDTSILYFYLIVLIILYTFCTIVRDRKMFPARSSGMLLLLSSILSFFGILMFIRSIGGDRGYGNVTCGPNGCTSTQILIFLIEYIQNILMSLLFPLLLFTTVAALLMMFAEIGRLKTERMAFDGASIIFAGSLLFLNLILGGNPALKIMSPAFLMVTLVLLMANRRYRHILVAAAASYIVPLLYW